MSFQPGELEQERNMLAYERTLLAAERTFLSWIRTGLTSVGIGVAIARLILFQTIEHQKMAQWIGASLILWGIGIFGFALMSYRHSCRKLKPQGFNDSFLSLAIATSLLIFLCAILFWIIIIKE